MVSIAHLLGVSLRRVVSVLCFTVVAGTAAAADWLDDMPSVPAVVDVVRQYTDAQIKQNAQLASNPDYFAMQLMGTFVLLRWVMEFQVETLGALPPPRAARMREIALGYMQAEYAIGLGTTQRNGHVRKLCQRDGPNRAFFKTFPSADECHRYVTQQVISNIYAAFVYRNAVFPLLFCERAKVYLDLMQKNILTLPAPERSPAVTAVMPDRVTPLGPAFCTPYGGDADHNGLCDDWEKAAPVNAAGGSKCGPVILRSVHTLDTNRLRVELDATNLRAGETITFRVTRAEKADASGLADLDRADAIVTAMSGNGAMLEAIVTLKASLEPDPARPFVFVETVSRPSQAPVRCEQPLAVWQQRQLDTIPPQGLHGPYSDLNRAVIATSRLALLLTATNEAGFVVLRDMRTEPRRYYTAPPLPAGAPGTGAAGFVSENDYATSLRNAFAGSCEQPSSFAIAAYAHTHPMQAIGSTQTDYHVAVPVNDNMSMLDFNFAIGMRNDQPDIGFFGQRIRSAFEQTYMINARNKCVRAFVPGPKDRPFGPDELPSENVLVGSVEGLLQFLGSNTLYNEYVDRQREVGCDSK